MANERSGRHEPNRVLAKTGLIVEALSADNELTPAEIAQRCDISRSTAYRILDGLVNVGLAVVDSDARYSLSVEWLSLADAAREAMTEWRDADEVLRRVTIGSTMTSYLTVRSGSEAVCIACAQGHGADATILRPGRTLPLFAGAAGRAVLAFSDDATVGRYLAMAPFPAYNEHTLTTAEELRADVARIRECGYAVSDEDVTLGIGAVGVPLFRPGEGHAVGALSAGGFVDEVRRMSDDLLGLLRRGAVELGCTSER